MTLLCGLLLLSNSSSPFLVPAGNQPARVIAGGTTILPNGRYLTPVGDRIYTGSDLWKVIASPDGKQILAFHDGGFSVIPVDTKERTGKFISMKESAPAAAFTPDGSKLLVSEGDDGEISVRDGKTFEHAATIKLNDEKKKDSYAVDIVCLSNSKALALDVANQDLITIDLTSLKVVTRTKAGRQPYALAVNSDGTRAYVANIGLFDYSLIPKPAEGKGNSRGLTHPAFGFPSKEATEGVEAEGRKVPGLGDPRVPDSQSVFMYDLSSANPKLIKSMKSGLLIHAISDGGKAVGGSAPNALLLSGKSLYVSNANSDTISIFDSKTLALTKQIKLEVSSQASKLRGIIPSALATDGKGKLFVCESGVNAVAVIDQKTNKVLGHFPTGWFPNSVVFANGQLFVGTQKGLGRGPQGELDPRPQTDERYGLSAMPGMIARVTPSTVDLVAQSKQVRINNGLVAMVATPVVHPPIKHIVFITKENHTYDGIFGALAKGNGQPAYAEFGLNGWIREKGKAERASVMPNHIKLAEQFAISDNFYMEPQASGDGHRWLVGVYPSLWTTRLFYAGWGFRRSNDAKGRLVSFGSNGSQIPEDYLENGSLWEHLNRGGIEFRNYGEGFEFPEVDEGPANSRTGANEVANYPMPKVLYDRTCFEYPIFNMNIPDIARADWFFDDIKKTFRDKGKSLPPFINIAICNDHGTGARPKDGYPYFSSFLADNDLALGRIVEYLSHTPEWKNMAIFVTQDDSGGDNDHVDRHRSFVLCISPYAKKSYVSHVHTSIMSVIRTIYENFGLGPNNMFDAVAAPLWDMLQNKPDFTPYVAVPADPKIFIPEATLDPNDPGFKKRRLRPNVRMDDPGFIERIRTGSSG